MKTLPKFALALVCLCGLTTVLQAQVPQLINYQGRVVVGTTNFDGSGQFKFALINNTNGQTLWSNDGTSVNGSQPTNAVALTVTKGLYSVLLGDTTITNMTALPGTVFTNSDVRLRVWFNDSTHGSQLLTPDQRLGAVGYIASGAVGSAQLASGAVGAANIAAGAVGSAQLASGLTLASPSFTGVINIPATTSASSGVIQMAGTPILSAKGTQNLFLGNGAGNFTLTGTNNTATGASSLVNDTSGTGNTAAGVSSLAANTTGFNNTATGFQALSSNTTASNNVATGQAALLANTTGTNNTATGTSALRNNNGSSNTAIGTSALTNNTSGANNIGIGPSAGQTITTGSNNIDVGSDAAAAAESNTIRIGTTQTDTFLTGVIHGNGSGLTGVNASAFSGSLTGDVTGTQGSTVVATVNGITAANVASGSNLANAATDADTVNAIVKRDASGNFSAGTVNAGVLSIPATVSGSNGVIRMAGAVILSAPGNGNFFLGPFAGNLSNNDATGGNVGVGDSVLSSVTGNKNTAVGTLALAGTSGGNSGTAVGYHALINVGSGDNNIGLGAGAGQSLTSGSNNIYIANDGVASESNIIRIGTAQTDTFLTGVIHAGTITSGIVNIPATTSATNGVIEMAGTPIISAPGTKNLFLGNGAGNFTLSGTGQNTGVGYQAMQSVTTGTQNTATGFQALSSNTTGQRNTAMGQSAASSTTTGLDNTAIGNFALATNTDGSDSTALGAGTLSQAAGSNNIAIGAGAGQFLNSGSNNIYIGSNGGNQIESDIIRIGNSGTQTDTFLTGIIHGDGSGLTGISASAVTGTITGTQIANGAVGNAQLASGAVGSAQLASGAVGSTALASGGVVAGNIATGAVTTTKIANGAVTGTQLASGLTLAGTTTGTFSGNGSALTSLNASNVTAGTLPVAQLPATVALRTGGNTFTGLQTFSGDGSMEHTQAASAGAASFMEFDDSTGGSVFRGIYGADGPTFSGASNQFTIATWTNSPLAFYTNQVRRMTIATDGTVGIGTIAGHGTLEIGFNGGSYTSGGGAGFNSSSAGQALGSFGSGTFTSAVYANGSVIATGIFAAISDARVKNIIGRSDAARDLSTLLGIEITDYRYKDVIAHGDAPFKKVIAQQVERVFPQAVNRQTGEVPDIYKLATIKDGWIALATDLKKGERVKLITDEAQGVYEVLEVKGGAFRTDFKPATEKVFVYGREVKDFRNVDYDAIAMLNVSATQQMQKEIESLKANQKQVATLRDENATLRNENAANAKRLATLEARDKEREARLARIEMSIPPAQAVSNTIAATKAGEQ